MKKILLILIVLGALIYLGVIRVNTKRAGEVARTGAQKSVELAKKGATAAGKGLQQLGE